MKDTPYEIKGTLVKDHEDGYGYNLNNRIDAERLYRRLTIYHKNKKHETNYKKINQQLTQIQKTLQKLETQIEEITRSINDK